MQQKKFSTMLTLKIINVFLADSTLRESQSAEVKKTKGRDMRSEEEKRKGGGGVKVPENEMRRLSTGRVEERGDGKRLGPPVRQCTSASSAERRAATLHPQSQPQGGRGVAEEVVVKVTTVADCCRMRLEVAPQYLRWKCGWRQRLVQPRSAISGPSLVDFCNTQ